MVANFWRSLTLTPEAVADFADHPVNEADLHARHMWLISQSEFREKMLSDPDYYDPKIAGWWVWGKSIYLAGGWCIDYEGNPGRSIPISRDRGVTANRVLGRSIPSIDRMSVHRVAVQSVQIEFTRLAARLRRTKVCCGDWERVIQPSYLGSGVVGVLLDPPYFDDLSEGLYAHSDKNISAQVRNWAIENGENKNLRIALCGYDEEHGPHMPAIWEKVSWKAVGGFGNARKDGENRNEERERIWFSPACLKPSDSLFHQYEETTEEESE